MTRQRLFWMVLWGVGLAGQNLHAQTGLAGSAQSPLLAQAASLPLDAGAVPTFEAGLPAEFARQRQALSLQRQEILVAYEKQQQACWQKFAVNACLTEARRARRQALDPVRQQELALNAQERAWRTEQRELRLQGKQADQTGRP